MPEGKKRVGGSRRNGGGVRSARGGEIGGGRVVMAQIIDKFTPAYDLEKFKSSDFAVTTTAQKTALSLGIDRNEMDIVVSAMNRTHFYKSMTSQYNHKVWQDVYHVSYKGMVLYVKFTEDKILILGCYL